MNQLEQQFKQKKEEFEKEAAKFTDLKAEKEKTEKIISAFKNELQEAISKTEKGLIASGEFSEDEYIEIRNQTTGLKARIEYQQAKLEDLQEKIYQQAEVIRSKRGEVIFTRQAIFAQNIDADFKKWLEENKSVLDDFFTRFYYSGKFTATGSTWNDDYIGVEEYVMKHIISKISSSISENYQIDEKLQIPDPTRNFTFKTPGQIHKEKFDKNEKGFGKLLNNL
ncbi:hypothetical protein A1D25_01745 [Ursidibacter arcticus]|uniref:hypothetical protein n=1 Tax=Ursidibacter arcticus TaxID=1524965 RepID=UPI0012F934C8|nr:hypothetical protein [Ursidibacter arcticus]KAE9531839.1 hypothetical protein A1D25_01745 [Ursidibacter arcticus]